MADISFWGGVGVIGSTKVLIAQDGWRILLDFGVEFSSPTSLYRGAVQPRPENFLRDLLRVGNAPYIPALYRQDALQGMDLAPGDDQRTAVFVSHAHSDHMGLVGWITPTIPIYCSPDTARLATALTGSGQGFSGAMPDLIMVKDRETVNFGPFRVTRYPVDHDIIGASAYAVETEDGVVAYTGDLRLHGRHPGQTIEFAEAVRGCRVLVTEGSMLGTGFRATEPTEFEVDEQFRRSLKATPGLVLLTLLPYNLERVDAFLTIAQDVNRVVLFPPAMARFLQAMGISAKVADATALHEVRQNPAQYVVQVSMSSLPDLLDLPLGPGSSFIHADGEPIGTFDPYWDILKDWLAFCHTPFWPIGTSGHMSPADLHQFIEIIHPQIVFPVHSTAPERLVPPPGTTRWIPQRGRIYSLTHR
ncbi:MAG: MBL fold metallo-hydrolase [Sulfobacillus thermotolerans]|nr:MBL fold metallo-hydrolase [Sulfobacillus thermotolerans]